MIIPPTLEIPHMKFPPFIILEGPDASGKSTLASHIAHRINAIIIHGASMGDSDMREHNDDIMRRYHSSLLEIITRNLALGHPVVCDRLWMSHIIYALERRPAGVDYQDLDLYSLHFSSACEKLGAFYVFALDDNSIENAMAHQDPDHPRNVDQMRRLLQLYKNAFVQWPHKAKAVRYDYTMDGKNVPAWLEKMQSHHAIFG